MGRPVWKMANRRKHKSATELRGEEWPRSIWPGSILFRKENRSTVNRGIGIGGSRQKVELPVNWQKQRANFYFQQILSICWSWKTAKTRLRVSETRGNEDRYRYGYNNGRNDRNRWCFAICRTCCDKRPRNFLSFLSSSQSRDTLPATTCHGRREGIALTRFDLTRC